MSSYRRCQFLKMWTPIPPAAPPMKNERTPTSKMNFRVPILEVVVCKDVESNVGSGEGASFVVEGCEGKI